VAFCIVQNSPHRKHYLICKVLAHFCGLLLPPLVYLVSITGDGSIKAAASGGGLYFLPPPIASMPWLVSF
jgi:hypothetical protein